MSTQLATTQPKQGALALMASRISVDPSKLLNTLKATVFKGATDEELLALVVVANSYNLNPLLKEMYAFPAKGGGIVPVVSVDGWINLANSHPQMDGMDFEMEEREGKLFSCTCTIHRKDRSHPIRVTEYLSECKRGSEPWKMEHRMLRHKALIQAVRVAFGFSGIYDEDEARDIAGMRDVTPKVSAPRLFTPAPAPAPKEDIELKFNPVHTEPEPEPQMGPSPHDLLRDQMQSDNVTIEDITAYARRMNMVKKGLNTIHDLTPTGAEEILASWQDVLELAGNR